MIITVEDQQETKRQKYNEQTKMFKKIEKYLGAGNNI
jgi:hypothetical protein